MEKITINRSNAKKSEKVLHIEDMVEKNNELVIKLEGKECYSINEGQVLHFKRDIYGKDGIVRTLTNSVTVKSEDADHYIHTTLPSVNSFSLLPISERFEKIVSGSTTYYLLKFNEYHNIFQQDLAINRKQELYFYDGRNQMVGCYSGISVMNLETYEKAKMEDSIVSEEILDSCGKCSGGYKKRQYAFLPEHFDEKSIIIKGYNEIESKYATHVETKFNPFYYYSTVSGETDMYGNPVKHCTLYEDNWWKILSRGHSACQEFFNNGDSSTRLVMDTSFFNVNLGLAIDADDSTLGNEDYFSEQFVETIEDRFIPRFIDMERVKYIPVRADFSTENFFEHPEYDIVTSITICTHFRERVTVGPGNGNTTLTKGNLYQDGWDIGKDMEPASYWNGYNGTKNGTFNENEFAIFMSSCGRTSDLIGYMNFNDNDLVYRKKKVSQSFFRLSFYTSTDPIEQKLLYYSTVFLDATELSGHAIKIKGLVEEKKENGTLDCINPITSGNENTEIVFYDDGEDRVDMTLNITNEYDRTRCSEGFNIYLFSDDAVEGNTVRTIYMKVEFNHAGNGKTIPMIKWPSGNGGYRSLTIDNFIENLYIPIDIMKIDGKYVYMIRGAEYNNGNARLVLFEPKIFKE